MKNFTPVPNDLIRGGKTISQNAQAVPPLKRPLQVILDTEGLDQLQF